MAKLYKLFFLTLLLQGVGIQSARAQWVKDGVPICTASGSQYSPQLTPDGSGGAFVIWGDWRNSNWDIYGQRIAPDGSLMWTQDGVAVCAAANSQEMPQVASDASGGAIIVWQDNRSGNYNYDIYAQRVDANGTAMWTANGVPICTASGSQGSPQIIPDGAGGAIITWEDSRSDNSDIYAQRVDGSGSVQWVADGVPVCTAIYIQWQPQLTSDGSGGAIIAWADMRSGLFHIYAQRIGASGTLMWIADGMPICTASGDQGYPQLTSDASGGAIVTWQDDRNGNYDIYAQRVNANGTAMWTANGVAICQAGGGQGAPKLTSDGSGGAIITWGDARAGYHIFAQRIAGNGTAKWMANGAAICIAAGDQGVPQISSDGSGGAVIAWEDSRFGNYDIYAQRVDANGTAMWTANGVAICTAGRDQGAPQLTSDGSGGALIAWDDHRNGVDSDIYAQRVDAAGHVAPEVATLLQNSAATFSKSGIALTWTLSEVDREVEFFIERSTASNGPFAELPSSILTRDDLSFTFIDGDWEPNTSYWYRVEYSTGSEHKTLFESGPVATPAMPLTLYQNNPNPFNPSTEIQYYLPEKCSVAFDVYDVAGALVTRLSEGCQNQGSHTFSWDGRDRNGRQMSSGVYFYRLKAGKTEISKKMVLTR